MTIFFGVMLSPFFTLLILYAIRPVIKNLYYRMGEGFMKRILFFSWGA